VAYFNKLINERLLDPESFTQDDATARNKFFSGESFVFYGNCISTPLMDSISTMTLKFITGQEPLTG